MAHLRLHNRILNVCICIIALIFLSAYQLASSQTAASDRYDGDGTLRRIFVPILMYHYVSPLPPSADDIRRGLTVEPHIFKEHLRYLREQGYTTITPYDLHNALQWGAPLPSKPILLTFDDSYLDHYEYVFPMLQEVGFVGTFFIITGYSDLGNPNHLTWEQIRRMASAGMSMEPHTKRHMDLRNRDYDFLIYEVMGSVESLQAFTQRPARFLAYPAGRYDANTLQVLETTPILRAMTTESGAYHTTTNYFELPRLRVLGNMSVPALAGLIHGAK